MSILLSVVDGAKEQRINLLLGGRRAGPKVKCQEVFIEPPWSQPLNESVQGIPGYPLVNLEDRGKRSYGHIHETLKVVSRGSSRPVPSPSLPRSRAPTAWWSTRQPWWPIGRSSETPTYEPVWYLVAPEVAQDTPRFAPPFLETRALLGFSLLSMVPKRHGLEERPPSTATEAYDCHVVSGQEKESNDLTGGVISPPEGRRQLISSIKNTCALW